MGSCSSWQGLARGLGLQCPAAGRTERRVFKLCAALDFLQHRLVVHATTADQGRTFHWLHKPLAFNLLTLLDRLSNLLDDWTTWLTASGSNNVLLTQVLVHGIPFMPCPRACCRMGCRTATSN